MERMHSVLPLQFWIIALLAITAWAPAAYVWRYLTHANAPRDITLPPDDLSWKSRDRLVRCLLVLAVLLAIALFVFTPLAGELASSRWFGPVVLGGFSSFALGTLVPGWRDGEVEPLVRGIHKTYSRDDQPKRYWASMAWNAALGIGFLGLSLGIAYDIGRPDCDDSGDLVEALASCDLILAEGGLETAEIGEVLAVRGRIHHRLDNHAQARADYTTAIEIDPKNAWAFYSRGLANVGLGDRYAAIEDFDAAIALRPEYSDVYLDRGLAYLDTRRFDRAIADFTKTHELDPDNEYAIANRSVAYAWLHDRSKAERDFASIDPDDKAWLVVLHAKAILADKDGDKREAIGYLSEAIAIDPEDLFAIRMRADTYWDIGERDLARDDDDRLNELTPEPIAVHVQN